eukprot:scaffold102676_cov31-Tisochrysis_lutea.AAC.4
MAWRSSPSQMTPPHLRCLGRDIGVVVAKEVSFKACLESGVEARRVEQRRNFSARACARRCDNLRRAPSILFNADMIWHNLNEG